MTWPERLAALLDVAPLDHDETEQVLDLARDIAHETERKFTPLSTFLLGVAVGSADNRHQAVIEAAHKVRTALAAGA